MNFFNLTGFAVNMVGISVVLKKRIAVPWVDGIFAATTSGCFFWGCRACFVSCSWWEESKKQSEKPEKSCFLQLQFFGRFCFWRFAERPLNTLYQLNLSTKHIDLNETFLSWPTRQRFIEASGECSYC